MGKIIEIQLGEHRSVYLYHLNNVVCDRDDFVIMEGEKGSEFGKVISDVDFSCKSKSDRIKGRVKTLCHKFPDLLDFFDINTIAISLISNR